MLQDLRTETLIRQYRKKLQILDLKRLQRLALFNPNFLHLDSSSSAAAGSFGAGTVYVRPSRVEHHKESRRVSNAAC